ncbi:MAG: lactate racemase domain-containing protein, partial [Actinomycetota bacterium]|nr:lactate racemase domain-containing protein [Actinomycetota bacterium]
SEKIIQELKRVKISEKIKPGMQIGITVGSRGIDNLDLIIKTVIQEVKKYGGSPLIISAMGSHGGATVEGQLSILASYGITEEKMGVPVRATDEVIELGKLENGLPIYFNKIANSLDGLIIVNRVKVHTSFKSDIESGLCKMLAVGLGGHKGATLVHSLGVKGLSDYMVRFAEVIIQKAPILCGIGILENGYEKTYKLKAANPEDFKKVDRKLLKECKRILPRLPVSDIDLLIIEQIGKNISGTGMDTNVIGGITEFPKGTFLPPKIKEIMLLDLTTESHGNAHGVGLATAITRRLYDKIDFKATYTNSIASGFLYKSRIPMIFSTEEKAYKTCLSVLGNLPGTKSRIIIIKNTLKLDEMYVSEPIWGEIKERKNILPLGDWEELKFDNEGKLNLKI